MKLTVGLGRTEDISAYAEAGADEFFAGYVPESWQLQHADYPLNRREVCHYNVNIGSETELDKLKNCKIPFSLAVNSLSYPEELYPEIAGIMLETGAESFIVADMGLILYLYNIGLTHKIRLHVSGEFGEMNAYVANELKRLGASRIIFHRKVTLPAMAHMTGGGLEYEAFLMNEMCHYTGAYCMSLHSDDYPPLCRMPYRLGSIDGKSMEDEMFAETVTGIPGSGGCGLCALWDMREAGITHLKIVGRGALADDMIRDIRAARQALDILESSASKTEFIDRVKDGVFRGECSQNCYYLFK